MRVEPSDLVRVGLVVLLGVLLNGCGMERNDDTPIASETRFEAEGFSVLVGPGIEVQTESPVEDFIIYRFLSGDETILSAYAGNQPKFPRVAGGAASPSSITIGGHSAQCLSSGSSKEWLVELRGDFPLFVHFWHDGRSTTQAEMADRIVSSLKSP